MTKREPVLLCYRNAPPPLSKLPDVSSTVSTDCLRRKFSKRVSFRPALPRASVPKKVARNYSVRNAFEGIKTAFSSLKHPKDCVSRNTSIVWLLNRQTVSSGRPTILTLPSGASFTCQRCPSISIGRSILNYYMPPSVSEMGSFSPQRFFEQNCP